MTMTTTTTTTTTGTNTTTNTTENSAALEPIKVKYSWISYGDLWTLAGVVAIEAMDGPKVVWRPGNPRPRSLLPFIDPNFISL